MISMLKNVKIDTSLTEKPSSKKLKINSFSIIPNELLIEIFKFSGNVHISLASKQFKDLSDRGNWEMFCDLLRESTYKSLFELFMTQDQQKQFNEYINKKMTNTNVSELKKNLWSQFKGTVNRIPPAVDIGNRHLNLRTIFDSLLFEQALSLHVFCLGITHDIQFETLFSSWGKGRHAKVIEERKFWLKNNLSTLEKIESLDLEKTPLKLLPNELGYFKALKKLSIEEFLTTRFPEVIYNLTSLKKLYISKDFYKSFIKELWKLKGVKIWIGGENRIYLE